MAYTAKQLKAVRAAERYFFERSFAALLTSLALYLCFKKIEIQSDADRGDWVNNRAIRVLDRWRKQFAPDRVGLPLESEWMDSND